MHVSYLAQSTVQSNQVWVTKLQTNGKGAEFSYATSGDKRLETNVSEYDLSDSFGTQTVSLFLRY
jgi:hypothetical protein